MHTEVPLLLLFLSFNCLVHLSPAFSPVADLPSLLSKRLEQKGERLFTLDQLLALVALHGLQMHLLFQFHQILSSHDLPIIKAIKDFSIVLFRMNIRTEFSTPLGKKKVIRYFS